MSALEQYLADYRLWEDESKGWTRNVENTTNWPLRPPVKVTESALVIVGKTCYTDMQAKHRYVDFDATTYVSEDRSKRVTAGEVARLYLKGCLVGQESKRVRHRREAVGLLEIPPADYWDGEQRPPCPLAMVDMTSAYWQLLSPGTLDMWLRPKAGGGFDCGRGRLEFSRRDEVEEKVVRTAVYGSLRSRTLNELRKGIPCTRQFPGKFLAPDAVGLCLLTMHAIAIDLLHQFNIRTVLTDCFGVREEFAEDVVVYLWDQWGVESRVKFRGPGQIYGLGSYEVGFERTKDLWRTSERNRQFFPAVSTLQPLSWRDVRDLKRIRWWLLETERKEGGWEL